MVMVICLPLFRQYTHATYISLYIVNWNLRVAFTVFTIEWLVVEFLPVGGLQQIENMDQLDTDWLENALFK